MKEIDVAPGCFHGRLGQELVEPFSRLEGYPVESLGFLFPPTLIEVGQHKQDRREALLAVDYFEPLAIRLDDQRLKAIEGVFAATSALLEEFPEIIEELSDLVRRPTIASLVISDP